MSSSSLPHLPSIRRGIPYRSMDAITLTRIGSSENVAEVSMVNSGLIRRDLLKPTRTVESIQAVTTKELVSFCKKAGELFMEGELPLGIEQNGEFPLQSAEDFVQNLSSTTGLPYSLCKRNMEKVAYVLKNPEEVINGLTRHLPLDLFDHLSTEHEGATVSYFPTTDTLGIVLPSNSPGVHSLWLPCVVMKIPVALKPGREDPWTPWRLIQALIHTGCPKELFSFYPTGHDGAEVLLQSSGRAIAFGGDATVKRYADHHHIQVHGTGRSKILLGEDTVDQWQDYLDIMVRSVADNGGRSCINTSCIITPRHGDAIAEALAKELIKRKPLALDDEQSCLAGFANPDMAEAINAMIDQGLEEEGAQDMSLNERESCRALTLDSMHYLQPTIVRCENINHPLANTEFLFPYASVIEIPQNQIIDQIGSTLVVTAITEDDNWINELLCSPDIDRLNIGPVPTSVVEWDQPHEGNLFEFLYHRRAIQFAKKSSSTSGSAA